MKTIYRVVPVMACLVFVLFFLLAQTSSANDMVRGTLDAKGQNTSQWLLMPALGASWDGKAPKSPSSSTLILYQDPNTMEFHSTQNVSVYVLNETEGLNYQLKCENSSWNRSTFIGSTPAISLRKHWVNTTYILDANLTYQHFKNDWKLENTTVVTKQSDGTNKTSYSVSFFLLVVNEYSNTTQYSLKWNTPNIVVEELGVFFSSLIYTVLFGLGIVLLVKAWQEKKKPDRKVMAHVYRNFAYGLIAGGITTVVWKVYQWARALDPSVTSAVSFPSMPTWVLGGVLSSTIFTFVTFACTGASIMFMSNSIEKDIQLKKIPYLTYFLLITELLIIVFAIVLVYMPSFVIAFGIVIYAWVGSVVLVALNIVITYLKVIVQSTGRLRQKSLVVLISLLLTFLGVILRAFVRPDLVANGIAAFFAVCLYIGIIME